MRHARMRAGDSIPSNLLQLHADESLNEINLFHFHVTTIAILYLSSLTLASYGGSGL